MNKNVANQWNNIIKKETKKERPINKSNKILN